MLRIAVQSKGRLFEDTMALLAESGIKVSSSKRTLLVQSSNFPVEILYLRDDDIPQSVASGVADLGIVGQNEFEERAEDAEVVRPLGFSKCRLSLAVPKGCGYYGLKWFEGKKIATSYPNILRRFMQESHIAQQQPRGGGNRDAERGFAYRQQESGCRAAGDSGRVAVPHRSRQECRGQEVCPDECADRASERHYCCAARHQESDNHASCHRGLEQRAYRHRREALLGDNARTETAWCRGYPGGAHRENDTLGKKKREGFSTALIFNIQ